MTNKEVINSYLQMRNNLCRDGCWGHNSGHSLFYKGGVLYSYGKHYPLAIRVEPDKYLVNSDHYSSTTGKQKSLLYGLLGSSSTVSVPTKAMQAWIVDNKQQFKGVAIDHYKHLISIWQPLLDRARSELVKRMYRNNLESAERQLYKFENWKY